MSRGPMSIRRCLEGRGHGLARPASRVVAVNGESLVGSVSSVLLLEAIHSNNPFSPQETTPEPPEPIWIPVIPHGSPG